MSGPDPHSLWIEDDDPDRPRVSFVAYCWTGNHGNRKARAVSILRRLQRGDWFCPWCGDPLPDYLRADARYCREACRKAAKRSRRKALFSNVRAS